MLALGVKISLQISGKVGPHVSVVLQAIRLQWDEVLESLQIRYNGSHIGLLCFHKLIWPLPLSPSHIPSWSPLVPWVTGPLRCHGDERGCSAGGDLRLTVSMGTWPSRTLRKMPNKYKCLCDCLVTCLIDMGTMLIGELDVNWRAWFVTCGAIVSHSLARHSIKQLHQNTIIFSSSLLP